MEFHSGPFGRSIVSENFSTLMRENAKKTQSVQQENSNRSRLLFLIQRVAHHFCHASEVYLAAPHPGKFINHHELLGERDIGKMSSHPFQYIPFVHILGY